MPTGTNLNEFTLQMKGIGDHSEDEYRVMVQKTFLDALAGCVNNSPVLSGRFKGNWDVAIEESVDPNYDMNAPIKSAEEAIVDGERKIDKYPKDKIVAGVVYNNLPYGEKLEKGSSDKAPDGIVAPTIAQLNAEI